jgi:flagellar assembly protein FliH
MVTHATFGGSAPLSRHGRIVPFFERPGDNSEPEVVAGAENPAMEPSPGMETLAPPLPPPLPQPGPEFVERLALAVIELRRIGQQVAEQASADTLEMAILIARRIIEGELTAGPAAHHALIRSAIRRLGESRRIVVRLCPADAVALEQAGPASPLAGLTIARLEIRGDATLSPGDCIVEGEHGTVDGRLETRIEEVRRSLSRALRDASEVSP